MSETGQHQSRQAFSSALLIFMLLFVSVLAISASKKAAAEADNQAETNAEKNSPAANALPSSLAENMETNPAPPENNNVMPDVTPPATDDDFFYPAFTDPAWNPYAEIERMQRDMDRMFKRRLDYFNNRPAFNRHGFNRPALNHPGFPPARRYAPPRRYQPWQSKPDFQYRFQQNFSTPDIRVKENASQYMVLVNLPGADENDISVTLDGQLLTVKGKQNVKNKHTDATGNIIFQERRSGRFQRSLTLSEPVSQNQMKTRLENGVLKVIIPKIKNDQWR